MIVCACPTTTVERNWIIPNFSIGGFYRVQQELVFASGKGVNVARVIHNLGGEVVCAGLAGGYSGALFKSLFEAEGLRGRWTEISGETRLSITVYDPQNSRDATSFCDYGPAVNPAEWLAFSAGLQELAEAAHHIALSGNIPPGIEVGQLAALISQLKQAGKQVWLDLSGPRLSAGVQAGPFAIKINLKEFSELVNQELVNPELVNQPLVKTPLRERRKILQAAREVRQAYDIPIVAITLGPDGSLCSSEWGDWVIHPVHYPQVVSSIGSGDAYLGGMLIQYARGAPLVECLRAASAAAGANTQQLGPGIFTTQDYTQALEKTQVERA